MTLRLCVLLWPRPNADGALIDYEDRVLDLVHLHGGRVLQRARTDGAEGAPLEIQILEFPDEAALAAYSADDRRAALSLDRDASVARSETYRVDLV